MAWRHDWCNCFPRLRHLVSSCRTTSICTFLFLDGWSPPQPSWFSIGSLPKYLWAIQARWLAACCWGIVTINFMNTNEALPLVVKVKFTSSIGAAACFHCIATLRYGTDYLVTRFRGQSPITPTKSPIHHGLIRLGFIPRTGITFIRINLFRIPWIGL